MMTNTTMARQSEVIIGVDAHKNTHHAVVITATGQRLRMTSPFGPVVMV